MGLGDVIRNLIREWEMAKRLGGFLAAILISATLVGCVATNYYTAKKDGIYFHYYAYSLQYAQQRPWIILRGNWVLDNFHIAAGEGLVMNKGKRYYGKARMDRDGDGKYEDESIYFFDIKLNHRSSNAVMWIQNQELASKSSHKALEVLMRNYAASLTGAGFYAEANVFSLLTVKQKRFVAVIQETKKTLVNRFYALQAKIQVFNIDQRKIQPTHQGNTLMVTMVKIPYKYQSAQGTTMIGSSVMIVGYVNRTEDFDLHRPAYGSFIRQLRFWKHK
jgi:hypothetical protein